MTPDLYGCAFYELVPALLTRRVHNESSNPIAIYILKSIKLSSGPIGWYLPQLKPL